MSMTMCYRTSVASGYLSTELGDHRASVYNNWKFNSIRETAFIKLSLQEVTEMTLNTIQLSTEIALFDILYTTSCQCSTLYSRPIIRLCLELFRKWFHFSPYRAVSDTESFGLITTMKIVMCAVMCANSCTCWPMCAIFKRNFSKLPGL